MKKYIRFLLPLMCAVLLLGLAACKQEEPVEPPYEPESASALWNKVDETMNALQTYEMTGDVKVVFYSTGYKFTINGTTNSVYTDESVFNKTVTELACAELSLSETTTSIEAYHEGKMYRAVDDGTYSQKFCSPMSMDEYADFKTDDLVVSIDIEDCTSAAFSKGEEDTWNLEFSGYTKKTVDQMLSSMDLTEEQLGASVADMKVSLTADSQFRVKEMTVAFDFAASEDMDGEPPEFAVTCKYAGYNVAQFDASALKAEEFVEIPDVRILEKVASGLQSRQSSTSGQFTLDLSTTYEYMGQTESSVEKDTVTYGKKNGAYYYAITAEINGETLTIDYRNGEQKVEMNGQSQTAAQSEGEAKVFIDGLIDSAAFVANSVSGVEAAEGGVYLLKVDAYDTARFDASIQSMGMVLTGATQQMAVTMNEESLIKLDSQVVITGTVNGELMTITVKSTVTFEDTASM